MTGDYIPGFGYQGLTFGIYNNELGIKGRQLTVTELITLLKQVPGDYLVNSEGCDCIGEVDRLEISVIDSEHSILLGRLE